LQLLTAILFLTFDVVGSLSSHFNWNIGQWENKCEIIKFWYQKKSHICVI